jgi:hypothetical protein
MTTNLVLQGADGNPLWQIIPDPSAADIFSIQTMVSDSWVTVLSVDQTTGRGIIPTLAINKHPGMPFQKGLSIGLGKKDGSDLGGGVNYLKMFTDDPLEFYAQMNIGVHPAPDPSGRYFFIEGIEQQLAGAYNLPLVFDPQNMSNVGVGATAPQAKLHVRTVDDNNCNTQSRPAIRVDGGNLASGWERTIDFVGNGGSLIVAAISAWLSGASRRLRFKVANQLVLEMHEDGGMSMGGLPSKGNGTINVGAIYVNGVLK